MSKTVFSGIQPSGNPTLGNYLGAMKNWALLQQPGNDCIYCVVDMHAITVRQSPDDLRRRSMETAALILACGVDPEKSILFIQSHVKEHAMLSWILCCSTYMGELNRMTQFKDKSAKHADNINAGLYTYPVLMAADILLYKTNVVPVGDDQKQHLEIARDIAERFNKAFEPVFAVPEPYINRFSSRIMSLQSPQEKMSKSDPNPNGFVAILDDDAAIMKKFKRAVTDSDGRILYDPEAKAGVSNLLSIYCACTGKSMDDAVKDFDGQGYGTLKTSVADAVIAELRPVRERYNAILSDRPALERILDDGRARAAAIAEKTMREVYASVGFDSCGY